MASRVGLSHLPDLIGISPFTTLWRALGRHFRDPRLRQFFGRYATYCGSSPFASPATLMLVAHVEREGVWLVAGGMRRLADALEAVARDNGAEFHFNTKAARVLVAGGRATGVETAAGERYDADAVIMNGDVSALQAGLLGEGAARGRGAPARPASVRSQP